MHVPWVRMSYVVRGGGRYAVLGRVRIADAAGAPVARAMVSTGWMAPSSAMVPQVQPTNLNGVAGRRIATMLIGEWQLWVTDMVLGGWVCDPASNVEPCDSIEVP